MTTSPITIANGESGSSVRTKLNNTGVRRYDPFFGAGEVLWTRPGLDIGGDGAINFNEWLNQSGIASVGVGNLNYLNDFQGAPLSYGTGYAPGDTVTLTGGTVITLTATKVVSASIVNAGSGGTPGHAVVIGTTGSDYGSVGLFTLNVTIAGDGTIGSIDSIANSAYYSVNPTDLGNEPVSDNSGSGITGAVVSIEMGAGIGLVSTQGSVTSNPVAQTGSSGGGTGATWSLYFAARNAVATDNAGGAPLVIEADVAGTVGAAFLKGGTGITGLLKTAPATPSTITIGVAAPANKDMRMIPFILYDSTSKGAWVLNWDQQAASNGGAGFPKLILLRYTDMTANATWDQFITLSPIEGQSYFQWFRYENDGTDIIFSTSYENIRYQELYRLPLASLGITIDKVGFGIERDLNGNSTAGTNAAVVLWNWVEG